VPRHARIRRASAAVLLAALLLAGCATPPPLATPSRRPEVTIPAASKKPIMDRIVSVMVGAGLQIKRVDEYTAVFGKVDESFAAGVLYGSRYDPHPEVRITYTLVESGPGMVTVYATAVIVRNPGSAFEAITTVTDGSTLQQMQGALERLKGDMRR
jgi:hypothetical protein